MKRWISVLLAVVMIASMVFVAVSAVVAGKAETIAEEATITLKNIFGESVSQTYYVGDTFTAYTYLNASEFAEIGGVSSVNATQYYTSSVVELIADYVDDATDFDFGMVDDKDLKTMFPVLCSVGPIANAGKKGTIYYNASTPSKKGCAFNSDTSVLIAATYKIKAAGEAVIENEFTTLALSDTSLTKVVSKGTVLNNNFTMPIALTAPTLGVNTVSGTVTSYIQEDGTVTVKLMKGSTVVDSVSGAGLKNYSFTAVGGEYVLSVSKANHVTHNYKITLNGDLQKNLKVLPIGDVSGDGVISVTDIAKANTYIKGKSLTDYEFACADTNNDKKLTVRDLAAMKAHIKEKRSLWK